MLQSEADVICSEEDLEMLSLLPQLDGLHVLELSAGISPFAGKIAGSATHVTTVDCVKMVLEKILPQKKSVQNVKHLQADVTKLDFPKATFDLIISSFQFMHLDEETLKALTRCLIRWLRPGGHLFFREFCSRHSGSRKQADYNHILQKTTEEQKCEGEMHGFDLVFSKCMNVKHKEDPLHFCWLLKKVTRSGKNCSLEEFLETERFSRRLISHSEWLFGQGFLSSGGLGTFLEMLSLLNLQPGEKVLDVGSGTGGAAFYMAKMFGVEVLGIDLCLDAFEIAQKRLIEENVPKVQFELCDATMREFPENTFDVVYSKDSLLYTMDKFSLFQKFHRWLKPTGRFIISDLCCGEKPWSEEFQKFADQCGYILWTLSALGKSLQDAGFAEVHVTDSNQKMVKIVNNYLKYVIDNQAEFIKNFSQAEYDDFVRNWKFREMALEANYYSWGLFQGKKKLAVNRPV